MPEFSDEVEAAAAGKRELRITMLARRRRLTERSRVAAAGRVQAELVTLVRQIEPLRMTCYAPVGSEPGGEDLPEVLLAALAATGRPGVELLLPVLLSDFDLDWAGYTGSGSLVAAGRGLREPDGPRLGPAAIGSAELIVVPALAVDTRGMRLGRGGGSYDRALARVGPVAPTVALLHDGELVETVPAAPHDQPVVAALTPSGGLRRFIPS